MRFPKLRLASLLTLALMFLAAVPDELYARRGGRISFGGGSRSFSRSYSKPSRAKSWGTQKARKPTLGGTRSQRRSTAASTTDRSVLNRARSQGTLYSSRSQATQAFRQKYGDQYTSKYSTRPSTRPSHIPQTTTVDGRQYDVRYNPQQGGYGYMMGGQWTPYNALADAAMLSMLMGSHGYAWGGGYGYRPAFGGFSFGSGLTVLMMLGGAAMMMRRPRRYDRRWR